MLGFVKSSNSCVYCGLSALTFITDLFVLLSITVYGTNYKSDGSHGYHIDIPPPGDNSAPKVIEIYYSLGYSFSLAIVALITMAISTIIGMITAICIKRTSRRHI
uniref:NADH dehydrogenase subunit 6 n=1 Tax=Acrobeloides nanus TaxID=290746 RepID=A0A914CDI5_9BILA